MYQSAQGLRGVSSGIACTGRYRQSAITLLIENATEEQEKEAEEDEDRQCGIKPLHWQSNTERSVGKIKAHKSFGTWEDDASLQIRALALLC